MNNKKIILILSIIILLISGCSNQHKNPPINYNDNYNSNNFSSSMFSREFDSNIGIFTSKFPYEIKNIPSKGNDIFIESNKFDKLTSKNTKDIRKEIVRLQITWDYLQPNNPNQFILNHPMIKMIKDYNKLGIEVIPTIQLNAKWTMPDSCSKIKSFPPKDFSENWDTNYGHSKSVYNFIKRFSQEYDQIIKVIVINNEVDQIENTWCEPLGDRHKYVKLMATIKKALIDTNPKNPILLSDSGMMGNTFSRLALEKLILDRKSIIENGGIYPIEKEDQIIELYDDFTKNKIKLRTRDEINWAELEKKILKDANSGSRLNGKDIIKKLNSKIINPNLNKSIIDIYNFHSYESSAALIPIINYIKENYAFNKPILTNEFGFSSKEEKIIEDSGPISEKIILRKNEILGEISPDEIIKKYVIGIYLNITPIVLFGFPAHFNKPFYGAFFSDNRIIRKPVKENIQMSINLQNRIGDKIISKTYTNNQNSNLQTYKFIFKNKKVIIYWIKNLLGHNNIKMDYNKSCKLYDVYGNELFDLIVKKEPIFLECLN